MDAMEIYSNFATNQVVTFSPTIMVKVFPFGMFYSRGMNNGGEKNHLVGPVLVILGGQPVGEHVPLHDGESLRVLVHPVRARGAKVPSQELRPRRRQPPPPRLLRRGHRGVLGHVDVPTRRGGGAHVDGEKGYKN